VSQISASVVLFQRGLLVLFFFWIVTLFACFGRADALLMLLCFFLLDRDFAHVRVFSSGAVIVWLHFK
jgi:hypothetical protein